MRRSAVRVCFLLLTALLLSGAAAAQTSFDVLHVFDNSNENPTAPVLAASDGNLYLPTVGGGTGLGAIYRLTPDGAGGYSCAIIHEFSGTDGWAPSGGLVEGTDGLLYGVTSLGGDGDDGVLYRISTSGTFEVVRSMVPSGGTLPYGELVVAGDGKLYGTAAVGEQSNGSVYRYDPGTDVFEIVYNFSFLTGTNPQSGLLLGSDGKLYGSTPQGGNGNLGTIFRIDTSSSFELLYTLTASDAMSIFGPLAEVAGSIYGAGHGQFDQGSLFRWNGTDGFVKIHDFNGTDGSWPVGGLVASGGALYGTTQNGGGLGFDGNVFVSDTDGNVTTLHVFDYLDGAAPAAHPIRVGTAWVGTTTTSGPGFSGTVFQIPDGGSFATVCAFGEGVGTYYPGPLFEASDGNLYGTSTYGGLYYEQGTIFRLGKDGSASTIHSFNLLDGRYPADGLVEGSDGALYGTTVFGGASNEGTAFRIDLAGSFSLLRSYADDDTGIAPAGFAIGSDGDLYGATSVGGSCAWGVLYRFGLDGEVTNLHDSCAPTDGPMLSASDGFLYGIQNGTIVFRLSTGGDYTPIVTDPFPSGIYMGPTLAEGPDQNFYGTTLAIQNTGAVFRIFLDGRTSILHTFVPAPGVLDSTSPLVSASDGRLYGASFSTTADDPGTVYRINVYGDVEVMHVFDPADPQFMSGLIQASDGKLYGLATRNSVNGRGVAYSIDLGTQVNHIAPASGPAVDTADVHLLGERFQDGATVTVGGIPATDVAISSDTDASATVPVLFPGTLNDVVLANPDASSGTLKNGWFADFLDVPQADPFHASVESVARSHVAAGYGTGFFGRDDPVTRAQMAVFLVKGGLGPGIVPTACANSFVDVPCPSPFADWIQELSARQITAGCGQAPPMYCPDAHVTRAQMAVFILKTLHGSNYTPPACHGIFGDVACPGAFAADWIEELYNSGVTAGCSVSPLLYCPDGPVSRGQMAVFLVRAFGLP